MSSKVTPELRLKKLRRLGPNVVCPNCGTAAPQGLGFGSVCVKFNTFICDLCKTSHQAISHRVKSITMSNWTHDEVNALTAEFGGGNEAALHIWLQNAPPCGQKYRGGSRPKEGDRVDIFKNFVSDCYDKGMFKANTPFVPSNTTTQSSEPPKPSSVAAPSRALALPGKLAKPETAPKTETVNFFDTDPEPSFGTKTSNANTSTSADPFACGSTFGDASPVSAVRSNYSSNTNLSAAGAGTNTNSSNNNYNNNNRSQSSPRFPAPPGSTNNNTNNNNSLFDAFNDTPGISPVNSFAQFPSSYPPAAHSPAARTASGFDFIEGDPFTSSNTSNKSNFINNNGVSTSFDSFAPTTSNASGTASGFDFLAQGSTDPFAVDRSGASSITSSNINSSNTNSAFTSQNDLFTLSTSATAGTVSAAALSLSAPSPVPSPVPPAVQLPHDPFGSVFLQPTSTARTAATTSASSVGSYHTTPYAASPGSCSPYTPPAVPYQVQQQAPYGRVSPVPNNGSMGMSNMSNMSGGGGYGMNMSRGSSGNVSPVPGMSGGGNMSGNMNGNMNGNTSGNMSGIGYGAGAGGGIMGQGQYPTQGYNGSGMIPPHHQPQQQQQQQHGMRQQGVGMGMGAGQLQQQPMAMLSPQYPTANANLSRGSSPHPASRVDAIGFAFGNLGMGSGMSGSNGAQQTGQQYQQQQGGYRGPSSQYQSQQQPPTSSSSSSFDFVQSAVKQHLPTNISTTKKC